MAWYWTDAKPLPDAMLSKIYNAITSPNELMQNWRYYSLALSRNE